MPEANGRSDERPKASSGRLWVTGRGNVGDLWWWFLVRGALAGAFGAAVLVRPDESLTTLVSLVSAYCLLHGATSLAAAARGSAPLASWLATVVSLAAGAALAVWPGVALRPFLLIFGAWALVIGASHLVFARSRGESSSSTTLGWLLATLGVALVIWPASAGVAMVARLIGYAALLIAVPLFYIASRLRFLQAHLAHGT